MQHTRFDARIYQMTKTLITISPGWSNQLNRNVLFSLRRHHVRWSNIRLEPSLAYGLRLYTNQSRLAMHVDRLDTHVISSILHIGRSEDAKPWPLYLEDLNGQTQQLYLEVGDILFYESSKCWHGRPQRFDGSWYTSLFFIIVSVKRIIMIIKATTITFLK
jgi:hypothetical protein